MTDSLSIAKSVTDVISLKIQITQSLIEFYKFYRYQNFELVDIIRKLESLAKSLQHLENVLSNRIFQVNERNLIKSIEKSITDCDELIQKLQNECQKFSKISSNEIIAAARIVERRAIYSFRQSILQKLNENIDEIRNNLCIALNVLQLKNIQKFRKNVIEMKALLKSIQINQISSNLRD